MKRVYLTFDMDWADDDVLKYFYDEMFKPNIQEGTLNVTNPSKVLDEIREDGYLELGIHPNFNTLLCNECKEGSLETVVRDLKEIVPEAVSARSHSLVTGSRINKCLYENGIKYVSNYLYQPSVDMSVRCFKDYSRVIQIPFFFEDDMYLMQKTRPSISDYLEKYDAPLVFNFHPIHLFLNSEDLSRYERSKKFYHQYSQLKENRNTTVYGIADFFRDLVAYAREKGYHFSKMKDGLWE